MTVTGTTIDMLNVGCADCFVVTTHHDDGGHTIILIDGGWKKTAPAVKEFLDKHLEAHGMDHICHMVSTHPDADHIGGLIEIVKDEKYDVQRLWIHDPSAHVNMSTIRANLAANTTDFSKAVYKSLDDADDLIALARSRHIPILEPFAGEQIGPFTVAGPTHDYYRGLLQRFETPLGVTEAALSSMVSMAKADEADEGLLPEPETSAENNSSVILTGTIDSKRLLFTADAGVEALDRACKAEHLGAVDWMQIPHHGSRRNINQRLIDHFRPKYAFVSADGNGKHPRKAVVEAFKAKGTKVYSTHHPAPSNKLHSVNVPSRPGYSPAQPL